LGFQTKGQIMSKQIHASHSVYCRLPFEIVESYSLAGKGLDKMRWPLNFTADGVGRRLGHELWEITYNLWAVLQAFSRDLIERVMADPVFRNEVDNFGC
jgi:hypothetical protein